MSGGSIIALPPLFSKAEDGPYAVGPSVAAIIRNLTSRVGAPEYVRTPQFVRKGRRYGRGAKDGSWSGSAPAQVPGFKPTVIAKREGVLGRIDRIRKHINKMSAKTYVSLRDKAFAEMEGDLTRDEEIRVADAVFALLSTNGFYGELYATFYAAILDRFPAMRSVLTANMSQACKELTRVECCDSNADYDKFCLNNRTNAGLRATGAFYVHLAGAGCVSVGDVLTVLSHIQREIESEASGPAACAMRDELAERVYAMLAAEAAAELAKDPRWPEAVERVRAYSERTPSLDTGFTAKSVFRHLDIIDLLRSRKLVKEA
tara:strand:+ start:999 stop:1949 length:951 start_codon:yes stop_codon:yes gene_type:complete